MKTVALFLVGFLTFALGCGGVTVDAAGAAGSASVAAAGSSGAAGQPVAGAGGSEAGGAGAAGASVEVDAGAAGASVEVDAGTTPEVATCAPRALLAAWHLTQGGTPVTCGQLGIEWVGVMLMGKDFTGADEVKMAWNLPCAAGSGTTLASFTNGPDGGPAPNEMVPPAGPSVFFLNARGVPSAKISVTVSDCGSTDLGTITVDVPPNPGPHAATTYTVGSGDTARVLGDSISLGGIGGPTSVKWEAYLQEQIHAGAFTGAGASGTTMNYFALLYRQQLTDYNPTIAFIEFGINDVISNRSPDDTAADLETGIRGAWALLPHLRFVILPVIEAGEQWEGTSPSDAKIAATNAATRAVADKLSAFGSITYVDDMRARWFEAVQIANPANDNGHHLLVDGLHPNDAGAHVISNIVAAHLAP